MLATLDSDEGKATMARSYLAYKEQARRLQEVSDLAYRELRLAQDAALAGKNLHTDMSGLVWDGLQLLGQHDLSIREARESRYKDFLAKQLTSALTSRNKDQSAKKQRLKDDSLLDHSLNKVVDDESKTNRKVDNLLKKSGGSSGGYSGSKSSTSTSKSYPNSGSGRKRTRSEAWKKGEVEKKRRYSNPSSSNSGKGKRGEGSKSFSTKDKDREPEKGRNKGKSGDHSLSSVRSLSVYRLSNCADFIEAFSAGSFSSEAMSLVSGAGLSLESLPSLARKPIAGRISLCQPAWARISTNGWVRSVVKEGYRFQWLHGPPPTPHATRNPPTDRAGEDILDSELRGMIGKGAVHQVSPSKDSVISGYFARPKKTLGKSRPIVSLKYTNRYIRKVPFRMTTTKQIKTWLRPGCYMTSLDLQDAYFSIPIHPRFWRYTRFVWRKLTFEYKVVMFGLGPSARVFTKILRAAILFLRNEFGIEICGYIDDHLIQADLTELSYLHTEVAILTFHCLGFSVNFPKSVLTPTQRLPHLGFLWHGWL